MSELSPPRKTPDGMPRHRWCQYERDPLAIRLPGCYMTDQSVIQKLHNGPRCDERIERTRSQGGDGRQGKPARQSGAGPKDDARFRQVASPTPRAEIGRAHV